MSSSFTRIQIPDSELVSQLREELPQALFEKLNSSLSIVQDRLKFAEYKVRVLEERLRLARIEKYGPGSEKLSDDQLELLELEPGVSSAEIQTESEREQFKIAAQAGTQASRQTDPAGGSTQDRTDHRLHSRSMRLRQVWQRDRAHRLREF